MIATRKTGFYLFTVRMRRDEMESAGSCYEAVAQKYAQKQDTQPWNVHYERPGTLSLLPSLDGLHVFDAGCGPGWYVEYLLDHGATVTAIDLNADFVSMTKERVGDRATVQQADLAEPLAFLGDTSMDLVVAPLVLHYLKDWLPPLQEFHRILKPGGLLVFSTHHPFMDFTEYEFDDYFGIQYIVDEWEIGTMTYYRRPLTKISEDLENAGFVIERLLEPMPTEAFLEVHPRGYEKLRKNPWFLFVRARKS